MGPSWASASQRSVCHAADTNDEAEVNRPQCGGQQANTSRRYFSPLTYWIAVLLDVSARMTWVLTLMPITLLSDDIIQRAVIQHSIIVVEIARRSMWSILRI